MKNTNVSALCTAKNSPFQLSYYNDMKFSACEQNFIWSLTL